MARKRTQFSESKPVRLRKPPAKSLDDKLTRDELHAFYDHSSDRSMAIVIGSIIENHLTEMLRLVMRRDTKVADELFKPTGPLGPFGTKIRIAYMLRTISPATYQDLIYFSKIRNLFAHELSVKSFADQRITAWVHNMQLYSVIRSMANRDETTPAETPTERVRQELTKDALSSTKDGFRMCARFMIHHLVDFETSIRITETALQKKDERAKAQASRQNTD